MCRLFGFRSVERLRVHHALKAAENALAKQSTKHPDGWGVGYYLDDQPQLHKGAAAAFQDYAYAHISEVVSSPTVIAHIRKATVGELSERNSHPFRFNRWMAAHNGHIEAFGQVRPLLLDELPKPLIAQIQGTTDSEHLFYLVLSELADFADLDDPDLPLDLAMGAVERALYKVDAWVERFQPGLRSETNLLLTNGRLMLALRRGSSLHYAMQREADAYQGPRFQKDHLAPLPVDRQVNHILIASEPLCGDAVWQETPQASILGVDHRLNWRIEPIHQRQHRVRGAKPLPDWPEVLDAPTPLSFVGAGSDGDARLQRALTPTLRPDANASTLPCALPLDASGTLHGEAALISPCASPFALAITRRLAVEDARLLLFHPDAATAATAAATIRPLGATTLTSPDAAHLPDALRQGVAAFGFISAAVLIADSAQSDLDPLDALDRALHDLLPTLHLVAPEEVAPPRVVLALTAPANTDTAKTAETADALDGRLRALIRAWTPRLPPGARLNAVITPASADADAAEVVLFLLSVAARGLHGQTLRVSGPPAAPPAAP